MACKTKSTAEELGQMIICVQFVNGIFGMVILPEDICFLDLWGRFDRISAAARAGQPPPHASGSRNTILHF